jgi:hypothetical protein
VLELVRRIEVAINAHRDALEAEGPELWNALQAGDEAARGDRLVGVLRAMVELDRLGDALAAWADDPSTPRPDAEVDATVTDVAARLDALGIPREQRQRPPREQRQRAPRARS